MPKLPFKTVASLFLSISLLCSSLAVSASEQAETPISAQIENARHSFNSMIPTLYVFELTRQLHIHSSMVSTKKGVPNPKPVEKIVSAAFATFAFLDYSSVLDFFMWTASSAISWTEEPVASEPKSVKESLEYYKGLIYGVLVLMKMKFGEFDLYEEWFQMHDIVEPILTTASGVEVKKQETPSPKTFIDMSGYFTFHTFLMFSMSALEITNRLTSRDVNAYKPVAKIRALYFLSFLTALGINNIPDYLAFSKEGSED
jgi:hypothetical protein